MKSSLKNNWALLWNEGNTTNAIYDFDDYTYGESHAPSIGDEVESVEDYDTGAVQYGILFEIAQANPSATRCGDGQAKEEIRGNLITSKHLI